jgi:hypothetical protein
LGIVLGGVLAEITRARAVADQLTRDLVEQYDRDPVLRSLSVPRVALDGVSLALRFRVGEVQGAVPDPVTPAALAEDWSATLAGTVVPALLDSFPTLTDVERQQVELAIASDLRVREIRARTRAPEPSVDAAGPARDTVRGEDVLGQWRPRLPVELIEKGLGTGDLTPVRAASVKLVGDSWMQIPQEVREKLGPKGDFTGRLDAIVGPALKGRLTALEQGATLAAALRSRLDVQVAGADIADPSQVQTITFTLRSADLDVLLDAPREG